MVIRALESATSVSPLQFLGMLSVSISLKSYIFLIGYEVRIKPVVMSGSLKGDGSGDGRGRRGEGEYIDRG